MESKSSHAAKNIMGGIKEHVSGMSVEYQLGIF